MAETFLPQFMLHIAGSLAPPELMKELIEIEVEDNLHLPDMFAIHIHDKSMHWTRSDMFNVGQSVEISVRTPHPRTRVLGPKVRLIQGEITGLEPELSTQGIPSLVVRGYDGSYRLHQGRQTRSFLQSTDDEIARRIAEEVGLSAEVQPTGTIYPHLTQNSQSNMQFLLERAHRLGYQLYVEDNTLYFGPQKPETQSPPVLSWGLNLVEFRASLTAMHQVEQVVVRGWDPLTKREIIGQAGETEQVPQVKSKNKAQLGFKGVNQMRVSRPVQSQAEADTLAQALRDEMGSEAIQAEGVCLGDPQIRAGKKVVIEGLGDQFNGEYLVTRARHSYHETEGYQTALSIGSRSGDTITALLDHRANGHQPGQGVMIGVVTNNKDPEGLGRVKVKYPGLDEVDESPWMRIAAPMAGEQRGFYCLPEINDEVLVGFEQSDIHMPYMLGMLWNGPDKPPRANNAVVGDDGRVNQRLIRSRSGHEIVLDDTGGQEQVTISDQSGNQIILANGAMTIQVKGNLKIETSGNMDIQAGGNMTIKGAAIDIN